VLRLFAMYKVVFVVIRETDARISAYGKKFHDEAKLARSFVNLGNASMLQSHAVETFRDYHGLDNTVFVVALTVVYSHTG